MLPERDGVALKQRFRAALGLKPWLPRADRRSGQCGSSLYNAPRFADGPPGPAGAQVAQLVEHMTENHGVGGSIPPLGTTSCSQMFAHV